MGTIFKYYSPQPHNFDALREGYFYLCKAEHLNDPFELSFSLYSKLAINEHKKFPNGYEPLKEYGICSFTPNGLNKRMWALYASNYEGFAVEFDEDFLSHYNFKWRDPKALPLPRLLFENVEYVDYLEELNDSDYRFSLNYYGSNIPNLKVEETEDEHSSEYLFIHLCRLKEKDSWEQEDEKRLIACRDLFNSKSQCETNGVVFDKNGYKIPFPKNIVKNIIYGKNISAENLEQLKEIARSYGLKKLLKVEPSNKPFDLTFKNINTLVSR